MTVHDHIAELRARLEDIERRVEALPLPDDAPIALECETALLVSAFAFLQSHLDAVAEGVKLPAIAESAPALESWRRSVLENPRAYGKRDAAAAWELTALECERAGNTYAAERARREAGFALGVREVA